MHVTRLGWLLVLITILVLASCEHEEQPVVQPPPPSVPTPNQHWVQGEQLKKVMGQLSGLREAIPRGVPEDPESPAGRESRQALAEAAALADALADTAERIPGAIQKKQLSEADRRGFVAEAKTLHDQAILLRDAAKSRQIEQMQEMLGNINATCISCHSRYRDLSGELNVHKALAPQPGPPLSSAAANGL